MAGWLLAAPTAPAGTYDGGARDAAAELAAVDSLLAGGRAAQATEVAAAAVRRHGEDPLYGWQLSARLGLALLRSSRPADALPYLEAAVGHEPGSSIHHANLGTALMQLGRRGRALTEFELAVESDPTDAAARLAFGQLLVTYRDYGRARVELEAARRLCDGCEEADRALALLGAASGDWPAAREPLERLFAAHPDSLLRRNLLAAVDATGADDRLAELLRENGCERWSPDEWKYAVRLEGRRGGAAPWSRAAVTAGDDAGDRVFDLPLRDDRFWGRVALNLLAAGEDELGLVAVDRAVALAPGNAVYHNNRAVLLLRLGREEEARAADSRARALADGAAGENH